MYRECYFNIHTEVEILFCCSTHFILEQNAEQQTNETKDLDLNGTWMKRTFQRNVNVLLAAIVHEVNAQVYFCILTCMYITELEIVTQICSANLSEHSQFCSAIVRFWLDIKQIMYVEGLQSLTSM